LFFYALAMTPHAHADLYKWTDGRGRVHYADQPPTVKAQVVKSGAAGQADITSQATQSLDAKEQAYQKRRKEAEKEAEQARMRRENCAKARNNLGTLQNAPRVYTTDAAGQRTYMDDAARARALAGNQKAVSDFCK